MQVSHSLGLLADLHLARVIDTSDPDSRGRIQVRLLSTDVTLWAIVATGSAGTDYGVSFLPRQNELVVLGFISQELPVVLGAVWSGGSSHPQEARPVDDNYTLRSPEQTQIRMDDTGPSIEIKTKSGYRVRVTEESGGEIVIEKGSEKIELTTSGIKISSSSQVSVDASQVKISASLVTVDASMSKFSGAIKCDSLIANSVVSTSYTPGAGNIW